MSVEKKNYFGIILQLPEKYTSENVRDYDKCLNCNNCCNGKFCSKCGSKTETIYKIKNIPINVVDVLEDDSFLSYHDNVYILNYGNCSNDLVLLDENFSVKDEINKFKEKNKDKINLLEQTFGNVKISYGILNYWY